MSRSAFFGVFLAAVTAQLTQQAAAQPLYLWEARQGDSVAYLFGSIHLCSDECYPLPADVTAALESSKALAVEIDPSDEKAAAAILQRGIYPEGDTVGRHLPPDVAGRYKRALVERGVQESVAGQMEPWFGTMVIEVVDAQRDGFVADKGVDMHLLQRARATRKPVVELESADEQAATMDSFSAEDELMMTQQTLDMAGTGKLAVYLRDLLATWRDGDAAGLYDRSLAVFPDAQSGKRVMARLLEARNRVMARRIVSEVARHGKLFVVIGAAHLAGPGSVQTLLETEGFRVRQLSDGR